MFRPRAAAAAAAGAARAQSSITQKLTGLVVTTVNINRKSFAHPFLRFLQ